MENFKTALTGPKDKSQEYYLQRRPEYLSLTLNDKLTVQYRILSASRQLLLGNQLPALPQYIHPWINALLYFLHSCSHLRKILKNRPRFFHWLI